jgi:predicted SAM-dependent methyltransferase
MFKRIINRLIQRQITNTRDSLGCLAQLNVSDLAAIMGQVRYFDNKIKIFNCFNCHDGVFQLKVLSTKLQDDLLNLLDKNHINISEYKFLPILERESGLDKINYACGSNYLQSWLNVDLAGRDRVVNSCQYLAANLVERHPFKSNTFRFGFCEDFMEHLPQEDSIIFLSEAFRTFKPGGVLRLSFPSLEGVLKKHYNNGEYFVGKFEAYSFWDHRHFYSKEELILVAKQIGFSSITFVEYGQSEYSELRALDTRGEQVGLNMYVELIR